MPDSNPTYTYVTGPVHAFIRIPSRGSSPYDAAGSGDGTIMYLGTTETRPEIDGMDVWVPHHNTIGGDTVPFDHVFQGSIETIRLDLSRFNQFVLNWVTDSPNYGRNNDNNNQAGFHPVGSIGKMLLGNKMSYELWLVNHHWWFRDQANNINAFPDLPAGMYYRSCKTGRKFRGRDGVTPSMYFLEIEAVRSYDAYERSFFLKSPGEWNFLELPDPL
jgi:hypothetical protein